MQVTMIVVSICQFLTPCVLMAIGRLKIQRDYFFLLIWLQALLYLHLAPTVAAGEIDDLLRWQYVVTQIAAFGLFELPLMSIYLWSLRRLRWRTQHPTVLISNGARTLIFCAAMVAAALSFAQLATEYDLWFRRIGTETIAARFIELPTTVWLMHRGWEKMAFVVLALLYVAFRTATTMLTRRAAALALIVVAPITLRLVLTNSRLDSAVLIAMLIGVHYFLGRRIGRGGRTRTIGPAALILGALCASYAFAIVANARVFIARGEGVSIQWLIPVFDREDAERDTEWWWRLNGIDLVAQIRPHVLDSGPAWGEAWNDAVMSNLGPLLDRARSEELKATLRTTPRAYLSDRYLGTWRGDYYSSVVTDTYGNFGYLGFLLSAVVVGLLVGWSSEWIRNPQHGYEIILGLLIVAPVLRFESELITVVMEALKGLVMALPIVLLRPTLVSGYNRPSAPAVHPTSGRAPLTNRGVGITSARAALIANSRVRIPS